MEQRFPRVWAQTGPCCAAIIASCLLPHSSISRFLPDYVHANCFSQAWTSFPAPPFQLLQKHHHGHCPAGRGCSWLPCEVQPSPCTVTFPLPAHLGAQSQAKEASLTYSLKWKRTKWGADGSQGFIANQQKAARYPADHESAGQEGEDMRDSWGHLYSHPLCHWAFCFPKHLALSCLKQMLWKNHTKASEYKGQCGLQYLITPMAEMLPFS